MCVRIPRVSTWVRHWSQRRKNVEISLAHTQRSAAIAQPIPIRQSQWKCGRIGEHQMLCGDWLVCQTISVCNNPNTCMAQFLACAYVCSDAIQMAILNWGPFGRWTKSCVRSPAEPAFCAFSNTMCGMSHRDQNKTASPCAVESLITNAWL